MTNTEILAYIATFITDTLSEEITGTIMADVLTVMSNNKVSSTYSNWGTTSVVTHDDAGLGFQALNNDPAYRALGLLDQAGDTMLQVMADGKYLQQRGAYKTINGDDPFFEVPIIANLFTDGDGNVYRAGIFDIPGLPNSAVFCFNPNTGDMSRCIATPISTAVTFGQLNEHYANVFTAGYNNARVALSQLNASRFQVDNHDDEFFSIDNSGVIKVGNGMGFDRLAFFGGTPVALQPVTTLATATAGATYGTDEQNMLNDVHERLREIQNALFSYNLIID